MQTLQIIADVISVTGGISAMAVLVIQLMDRLIHCQIKIYLQTLKMRAELDGAGGYRSRHMPAITAMLINRRWRPIYLEKIYVVVDGVQIEPYPFQFWHLEPSQSGAILIKRKEPLEPDRSRQANFRGFEILELLPPEIVTSPYFKLQVFAEDEAGRIFKSNTLKLKPSILTLTIDPTASHHQEPAPPDTR